MNRMSAIARIPAAVGRCSLERINLLGEMFLFLVEGLRQMFTAPGLCSKVVGQLYMIGAKSLFVILLIGLFTGMVLGLQGYYVLIKFGSAGFLGAAVSLTLIRDITENLYLPLRGEFANYPVIRENKNTGGVSGSEIGDVGRWRLSSDTCAAFMSIDGLSHAYQVLKDPRLKDLLDEMIAFYSALDKAAMKAQTHCTLTAGRAMMRMHKVTGEEYYRDCAAAIWDLYRNGGGMSYTWQNLNWWGRPETWTEPCAVVDSLILALELYKATGDGEYRTSAARIWHNGFAALQRSNGGAGTDTVVTDDSPWDYLAAQMYEAPFCCTMRLAEGLWYVRENRDLLYAEMTGEITKQDNGTYTDGDILYAEVSGGAEEYGSAPVCVDGHLLMPLVKYYRVPDEIMSRSRQQVIFR